VRLEVDPTVFADRRFDEFAELAGVRVIPARVAVVGEGAEDGGRADVDQNPT
jgi:hypothetical protein